jgi:hypothetical protein
MGNRVQDTAFPTPIALSTPPNHSIPGRPSASCSGFRLAAYLIHTGLGPKISSTLIFSHVTLMGIEVHGSIETNIHCLVMHGQWMYSFCSDASILSLTMPKLVRSHGFTLSIWRFESRPMHFHDPNHFDLFNSIIHWSPHAIQNRVDSVKPPFGSTTQSGASDTDIRV